MYLLYVKTLVHMNQRFFYSTCLIWGESNTMNAIQLFVKGGLVMYPLMICSIIAVSILIERVRVYKKAQSDMNDLKEQLPRLTQEHRWHEIIDLCEADGGSPARVIQSAVSQNHILSNQPQIVEAAAMKEASKLRAYLNYLETITTLAPLLGLLGTVTGMIGSFSILSVSEGQPFAITGGVGEALIATATGLCVAIIALSIHTYLVQRQDNLITDIEDISAVYLIALAGENYEN